MKATRNKTVLGLAIGERSMLVAEVVAGTRASVRHVGEMVYEEGVSASQPAALGKALAHYLKEKGIAGRNAVVGIPAKWLLVKGKEVPAADEQTLTNMLRLEAESEFSADLKDLVYDYASQGQTANGRSVLLVATQRKHVDAVTVMCEGARVNPVAVTATGFVLGQATGGRKNNGSTLVLSLGLGSSELTAQQGKAPAAIRHLRASSPAGPFVSELRRAVSTMGVGSSEREMVMWGESEDGGTNAGALGDLLGLPVRSGELASLGVEGAAVGTNGSGSKNAPAVALALVGLEEEGLRLGGVDFLHSRLAPPAKRRIPLWVYGAVAGVVVLILGMVWTSIKLGGQQAELAAAQKQLMPADQSAAVRDFVSKVNMAQGWFGQDTRYLACMRDLLLAVPDDGQTYATSLEMREVSHASNAPDTRELSGILMGRTSDKDLPAELLQKLSRLPSFKDVTPGNIDNNTRGGEVNFTITFDYAPVETVKKK